MRLTRVVRDNLAKQLGMTEADLFKCAVENTRRIFPPMVKSMNDVMRDMMMSDGMPAEIADMMLEEMPADRTMWIISNDRGVNGAGSMLYEDVLHKLAMKLESDLYLLPSSVHECIAVSVDMGDPYELAEMVNEINMSQVSLEERLSNQVYHYDKDARRLTLATDTPNKRLDGMVAEARHDIHSMEELASTVVNLTDKRKESSAEKSRIYRARQRCKSLFDVAEQMDELQSAENSFQMGDKFFTEEHRMWMELEAKLNEEGYSYEEIKKLREYYREQIANVSHKERASTKELNLGKAIWKDMVSEETDVTLLYEDRTQEKTQDKIITKQPKR